MYSTTGDILIFVYHSHNVTEAVWRHQAFKEGVCVWGGGGHLTICCIAGKWASATIRCFGALCCYPVFCRLWRTGTPQPAMLHQCLTSSTSQAVLHCATPHHTLPLLQLTVAPSAPSLHQTQHTLNHMSIGPHSMRNWLLCHGATQGFLIVVTGKLAPGHLDKFLELLRPVVSDQGSVSQGLVSLGVCSRVLRLRQALQGVWWCPVKCPRYRHGHPLPEVDGYCFET
jgi:hypothetical protein